MNTLVAVITDNRGAFPASHRSSQLKCAITTQQPSHEREIAFETGRVRRRERLEIERIGESGRERARATGEVTWERWRRWGEFRPSTLIFSSYSSQPAEHFVCFFVLQLFRNDEMARKCSSIAFSNAKCRRSCAMNQRGICVPLSTGKRLLESISCFRNFTIFPPFNPKKFLCLLRSKWYSSLNYQLSFIFGSYFYKHIQYFSISAIGLVARLVNRPRALRVRPLPPLVVVAQQRGNPSEFCSWCNDNNSSLHAIIF